MVNLPPEVQFSVIFDRNDFQTETIEMFNAMKKDTAWPYHHRLGSCVSGNWEEDTPLQAADLIAYETFKLIHSRHYGAGQIRQSLASMFGKVYLEGKYFDAEALEIIKPKVEASHADDNQYLLTQLAKQKA